MTPATMHVLVRTAANGSAAPWTGLTPARIAGLTKMMYDITTKVVAPAIVSRARQSRNIAPGKSPGTMLQRCSCGTNPPLGSRTTSSPNLVGLDDGPQWPPGGASPLFAGICVEPGVGQGSGEGRTRTGDTPVFSRVLY